jgi:putative ABC transport system permease protein
VVLTLALGIGANTAIFSILDAVLLHPLPSPHPEQLVALNESLPRRGIPRYQVSAPNFKDLRDQAQVFSGLAAIDRDTVALTGGTAAAQTVTAARVTGDFFRVLGVRAAAGRLLLPTDDTPQAERVVVLGSDLWHQRFGGDPGILGRQIKLNGRAHIVVGVAPRGLDFPATAELWVPAALDYAKEDRADHYLTVIGRLRPGVTLARARAAVRLVAARLRRTYPETDAAWGWDVVLTGLRDLLVENLWPALTLLAAAVWLVLLIACANVAHLLLARTEARRREIALRSALGAGRGRLIRQLLGESVLLALAGGALALPLAWGATRALTALSPDAVPGAGRIGLDLRVFLYAAAVALATGVLVGLVPALAATRGGRLQDALREAGRGVAGSARGRRLRNLLILAEVALALVLLTGAGLLVKSFALAQLASPGCEPRGVLTAQLSLLDSKYPEPARQAAFFQEALRRIRALPGVRQAATVLPLPYLPARLTSSFTVEGRPAPGPGAGPHANLRLVSPGFFRALGIPLLGGRDFTAADDHAAQPVVIVNHALAARTWPGASLLPAMGRRLRLGDAAGGGPWAAVVGVVGDLRAANLAAEPDMELYWPQAQMPDDRAALVVRAAGDPWRLAEPLRRTLRDLDPDLPVDRVLSMDQVLAGALAQNRLNTALLGAFAALALFLAALGIYSVVAHSVAQREREIGIRLALGARPSSVIGLFLRQEMAWVGLGLLLGLAGAWGAARLLAGQLYRVTAADPPTYAAVTLLLGAVALAAVWLPARRALRLDQVEALRRE